MSYELGPDDATFPPTDILPEAEKSYLSSKAPSRRAACASSHAAAAPPSPLPGSDPEEWSGTYSTKKNTPFVPHAMKAIIAISLAATPLPSVPQAAQSAAHFRGTIPFDYQHLLYLPDGYTSNQQETCPLALFLHG